MRVLRLEEVDLDDDVVQASLRALQDHVSEPFRPLPALGPNIRIQGREGCVY